MVRNRPRKSAIGLHTEEEMKVALDLIYDGKKIREVAKLQNIPYTTLYRYYKKSLTNEGNLRYTPNYDNRRIFTMIQEKSLVEFIIKCSQMFYGLTPIEVRQLAYEMAQINGILVPPKWHETKQAGIDWLYHFRKRHSVLSLRTPEGCSLSRATAFNKHNVSIFFDNLHNVMLREPSFGNGIRVYNLDETNTMTVQKSGKVLAIRGQKQISKVTSAEKGTLVTTCYIVNALGQALPPVMIFPRVHFKQHMLAGAPTGTLGLANPSGWMNSALFVKTMQHFINHTQSSKENPSLLIMDNYEAHISIEAITLAKENGVTILTVPPHSTSKLQPLDVAIFKPFKVAYNAAVDSWLMRNPGKTFSIYEVAQCITVAHMKSMTPANICSAFQCTGIYPYNRDIFSDLDFAPSAVTDRENEQIDHAANNPTRPLSGVLREVLVTKQHAENVNQSTENNDILVEAIHESPVQNPYTLEANGWSRNSSPSILIPHNSKTPSPLKTPSIPSSPTGILQPKSKTPPPVEKPGTSKDFLSPLEFRGLPKAGARKSGRVPRRKGKSMVATDTPNKLEIEKRHEEKRRKQRKKDVSAKKRKVLVSECSEEEIDKIKLRKKIVKEKKTDTYVKNKGIDSDGKSESSEEDCDTISIYSEEEAGYEDESEDEPFVIPENFEPLDSKPKEGDFILVEFDIGNRKVFYLAKVIGEEIDNNVVVSYLRKSSKMKNTFQLPNVPDIATVLMKDIKMILPKPAFAGGTKRQQGVYKFDLDLSRIDLR